MRRPTLAGSSRAPRRGVIASLAVAAIAAIVAVGQPVACQQKACTLLACGDVHASLRAHVHASPATLLASKTVLCWNLVCAALTTGSEAGVAGDVELDPLGALKGTPTVTAESTGALLDVELMFFTRALDGTFMYTRQANGDHYRVTVTGADGKTLFDVEKDAVYDTYYPNGPDCDLDPCMHVTLDLGP